MARMLAEAVVALQHSFRLLLVRRVEHRPHPCHDHRSQAVPVARYIYNVPTVKGLYSEQRGRAGGKRGEAFHKALQIHSTRSGLIQKPKVICWRCVQFPMEFRKQLLDQLRLSLPSMHRAEVIQVCLGRNETQQPDILIKEQCAITCRRLAYHPCAYTVWAAFIVACIVLGVLSHS